MAVTACYITMSDFADRNSLYVVILQGMTRLRMDPRASPYLAYIEYRMANRRAKPASDIWHYFRQSMHHSMLWMTVMRGYYLDQPVSFKSCITAVGCSRETARKIIFDAQAKGYFLIRQASDDRRKKLVAPTKRCVEHFEHMVRNYLNIFIEH